MTPQELVILEDSEKVKIMGTFPKKGKNWPSNYFIIYNNQGLDHYRKDGSIDIVNIKSKTNFSVRCQLPYYGVVPKIDGAIKVHCTVTKYCPSYFTLGRCVLHHTINTQMSPFGFHCVHLNVDTASSRYSVQT